jgi:hypothetical protein
MVIKLNYTELSFLGFEMSDPGKEKEALQESIIVDRNILSIFWWN